MLAANILLGVSCLVLLVLVLLIIVSNPRRALNRALAVYIASTFFWLFTNLLTNLSASPEVALFFAKMTIIPAAIIPYAFFVFCGYFVGEKITIKKLCLWGIVPFIIILTAPTSLNIISVEAYGLNSIVGASYYLLVAELLLYPLFGLSKLQRFSKQKTTSSQQRVQVRYIMLGGVLTLLPGVIINAILPLFGFTNAGIFGSNVVIILALFTSVAIIRHKLLNVRFIVARSLAYTLLLFSLASVYGVFVFGLAKRLGDTPLESFVSDSIPFIAAIALALFYRPLKRFFDRLTNKYFYQDAYETKDLLDEFNQTIVSTIELDQLLNRSAHTIQKYLKSEYCAFALTKKDGSIRLLNEKNSELSKELVEQVRGYIHTSKNKSVITDLLEADSVDLKSLLQEAEVGAVIRITKNAKVEGQGYIFMGYKKSGTVYGLQDTNAMEIVANELAIAIENALQYEEIQNFAKTLQDKVDEATRNLRKANEKLKALDQTKDDFISMASHQLRTPLTSVKGYVSMVLEGDAGKVSSKQKELLDQAFVSSQRMVYLIADLLNVSRLRTGKFIIEAKPTNLADVIEGEIKQLTETAKGRGLELAYDKPKNFPTLMLDDTKIRQVIMNFADNAIYYTPSGGHVRVAVEDKNETIEFTVTDDGLGVPKSEQHHLFNKFYRASNAKKARPDGTGLGLFMAKKVIVAQGGAIIFKTEEGKGSTFGFSFAKKPLLPEHFKGAVAKEQPANPKA